MHEMGLEYWNVGKAEFVNLLRHSGYHCEGRIVTYGYDG
jgi:hypothetical protein